MSRSTNPPVAARPHDESVGVGLAIRPWVGRPDAEFHHGSVTMSPVVARQELLAVGRKLTRKHGFIRLKKYGNLGPCR